MIEERLEACRMFGESVGRARVDVKFTARLWQTRSELLGLSIKLRTMTIDTAQASPHHSPG